MLPAMEEDGGLEDIGWCFRERRSDVRSPTSRGWTKLWMV